MNTMFCRKLFVVYPFHSRNVFSTLSVNNAEVQSLSSNLLSSKLNMSATDISRLFKRIPRLEKLQNLHNIEQLIHMLNRIGCSEAQIVKIMRVQPSLMFTSAERVLEPKIKLLEDFGFQGETLAKLLARNPSILSISLENDLLPKMEFLKNIFQSQQFLVKSLLRAPFILSFNLEKTLKPSVVFWEKWGFQGTELRRLLRINLFNLQRTSLTPDQSDLIQEIGANKESNAYIYIVSTVATGRMVTLKAKVENFKVCGLSAEETCQVCRVAPQVLRLSKETVRETMHFVVKDMKQPPNYIVTKPYLLLINLEKVMRPRFVVWQKIKSINGPGLSLYTVLTMPKARFVRNIIRAHPESRTLWILYENAISNASKYTESSIQS